MPLPFIAIAIPVVHSSGMWIASTAASGYLGGTLSSTWIGAFVLGNSGLLSSMGVVSGAGIFAAAGGAGLLSGAASGAGALLTSVGLGGVASALGIAPVTTFLGLTPVGWAVAGGGAVIAGTLGTYITRKTLRAINEERAKGGLPPTTVAGILREARALEDAAMVDLLRKLQSEGQDIQMSPDESRATIEGETYPVRNLSYDIGKDGSESICVIRRFWRRLRVLLIRAARKGGDEPDGGAPTPA